MASDPTGHEEAQGEDAFHAPHAIDFASFLLSLGSSALVHLGELEHPDHPGLSKNLALAKQSLDILAMLQDKTRGNLSAEESKLLEQLLYELRIKYVAARG
jgi:hypothetical protein